MAAHSTKCCSEADWNWRQQMTMLRSCWLTIQ